MQHAAGQGSFDWIHAADFCAVAIVGICKNAGKTTLLNYLLSKRRERIWGVFSTGIDGEERDTVFRIPKPAVKLDSDLIFCCDTPALDKLGSGVAVLEKLPAGSSTRPLWLARSLAPLQTEITGPGSVSEQTFLLHRMQALGAAKVLIDGSLDRKSIALSEAVDSIAVMIGASFGSIAAIIGEIRRLEALNALPEADIASPDRSRLLGSDQILCKRGALWSETGLHSLLGNEKALKTILAAGLESLYIPGALTDSVYGALREPLAASGAKILLRHPECLKLGLFKLERFVAEVRPEVLIPFRIRGWALNSAAVGVHAIDAADFRAKLRKTFPHLDLPDIRELAS